MRKGFTLIELLTVIAIIGILAGILIPVVIRGVDEGRKAEARNTIAAIELAVEQFKLDNSQYPWPPLTASGPLESADVIRELIPDDARITAGQVPTYNRAGKVYITTLKDERVKGGELVDPWGNEYRFTWDAVAKKLLIYSCGVNGFDDGGGGDDLTNQ